MNELSFKFSEEACIKLILEFLQNRDLNISQLSLERETGVINGNYSDDLLFLRQLILDGQWDHVIEFISPLESITTFDKRRVRYILNKYKYIELLCYKFEIGKFENPENCVKKIVDCLNELENYCSSKEDYNNFCLLLTLENFDQHSEFKNWNPIRSRISCFNDVLTYIEKYLPIIKKPGYKMPKSAKGDRLMQIIIKGLLYESCLEFCQNRAISSVNEKIDFKFSNLLEETKLNRSDSSLLSWLQSIPPQTFNFQFEDKKLNVNIEKLDKPSLIATWSEIMLTTPIKPKEVFPHSATPFTRLKATDLMSKSLTSGIVDGLSKSIMSFSLKDAVDMSHSSIATTEFHLSQSNKSDHSKLNLTNLTIKDKDEKIMEKMFEQGNVFNSSLFGKLSTINEDKVIQDLNRENQSSLSTNLLSNINLSSSLSRTSSSNQDSNLNSTSRQIEEPTTIEEMKIQLEQFATEQWKEFLKKKDELLMSSVTKATAQDLIKPQTNKLANNLKDDQTYTPAHQTGQSNFKDLQSLITSTPKATPKDNHQLELTNLNYNPVRLNFSNISADSSNTVISEHSNDFHNHTTKLASNLISSPPKNVDQHFANLSKNLDRFNNVSLILVLFF